MEKVNQSEAGLKTCDRWKIRRLISEASPGLGRLDGQTIKELLSADDSLVDMYLAINSRKDDDYLREALIVKADESAEYVVMQPDFDDPRLQQLVLSTGHVRALTRLAEHPALNQELLNPLLELSFNPPEEDETHPSIKHPDIIKNLLRRSDTDASFKSQIAEMMLATAMAEKPWAAVQYGRTAFRENEILIELAAETGLDYGLYRRLLAVSMSRIIVFSDAAYFAEFGGDNESKRRYCDEMRDNACDLFAKLLLNPSLYDGSTFRVEIADLAVINYKEKETRLLDLLPTVADKHPSLRQFTDEIAVRLPQSWVQSLFTPVGLD